MSTDGVGPLGKLSSPWGIARSLARDANGLLLPAPLFYIGDTGGHAIRALNYSNATLFTWAGTIGVPGFVDGPTSVATFKSPTAVAVNYSDALFIADSGNHAVRLVVNGVVSTVGGTGLAGYTNGLLTTATFNSPYGISCDTLIQSGVFVADTLNHAIRKLTLTTGVWVTYAGNGTADTSPDGALSNLRLAFPRAVLRVEVSNRIYVADTGNGRVVTINTALGTAATLIGGLPGRPPANFGSGPSALAVLWGPVGLALGEASASLSLFVSNSGSRTVQAIEVSSGSVTLVAGGGSGVEGGAWDGWTGAGGGSLRHDRKNS